MSVEDLCRTRYMDRSRHWSPHSQKYAGGDHLISALRTDWHINELVYRHETGHGPTRPVIVYYFELKKHDRVMTMPVLANPLVESLILRYHLHVIQETPQEVVAAV